MSETTVQPNPQHQDYLSLVAKGASDGLKTLRTLESLANDYSDLLLAPNAANAITSDDAAGTLSGMDVADVLTAMQGIAAIGDLLAANDGALRKAFKRLAQYAR